MENLTMSPTHDQLIAATDKDIMAESLDRELPDHDDQDQSLEEMGDGPEGDHLPDDDDLDELEAKAPDGDDPKKPADADKPVDEPADEPEEEEEELPSDIRGMREAMFAERKARQAAEAAQRTAREEIAAERARIDRILAERQQYPQQQPQQAPPQPPEPDPVLDPQGYRQFVVEQAKREMTLMHIQRSFAAAHEQHGKAFEEAYNAMQRLNPNVPYEQAVGNRIYTSPDPAMAMMKWHREQTFLREAGSDPAAYKAKLREELVKDPDMVKAVLASLREQREGGTQGSPRNVTRLPPSLNRVRGGSSSNDLYGSMDNSDEAIMHSIMTEKG